MYGNPKLGPNTSLNNAIEQFGSRYYANQFIDFNNRSKL